MANPVTKSRAKVNLQQPPSSLYELTQSFPRSAVHGFVNMEAFNTRHNGLTGVWNLVMHPGFLDLNPTTENSSGEGMRPRDEATGIGRVRVASGEEP